MKNIRILSVIFIWVGTIILASFQGIFLMTYKTMPLDNTFFIFAQSVVAKISLLLNSTILSSQENIETLNFVVKHSELIGAVLFLIIFGLSLFFIVPLFSWSNIKKRS
ncbi:hypothetical protein NPX79_03215 [Spiroplasma endosymbiont of Anurida maritima]|uniref:hypothetical protein n=1 Tax=Spiroplasma endosymbiont of Anurida maritima TaxID=2967972 RepID=UPI0036D22458